MGSSGKSSGNDTSSGNSPTSFFTARTPILGLKLYVVIIATVLISISIFVFIFLFLRSIRKSKRRRICLRQSSGLLPLVCKEIVGVKNLDHSEISKVEDYVKKEKECRPILSKDAKKCIEIESSEGKKASSESNESSTSRSESSSALSASTSSDGMQIGWGRCYSLKELEIATNGFTDDNVIGEGGYGIVYRGILLDGSVVAVKNLLNNK